MDSMKKLCSVFVVCVSLSLVRTFDSEIVCSKFPYEEKMLEKMIRMEIKVEDMVKDIKGTQEHVRTTLNNMENTMKDFADNYKKLEENVTQALKDSKAELDLYQEAMKKEVILFKDGLKFEIDIKKTEIDMFMDNSTDKLKTYGEILKAKINDTKVEVDKHKDEITDELSSFMMNITADVQKEVAELDLLEVKLGNPAIAFNVHGPSDLSIGTAETFQYADVLLNKGTGFNTSTGRFSAPMTGLYYFSAHVCAVAAKFVHYGIVVGDSVLASSTQREDTDSSCGSVSTVATVSDGEEVYVKCLFGNKNESQISENTYRWNSFVGALIQ